MTEQLRELVPKAVELVQSEVENDNYHADIQLFCFLGCDSQLENFADT